MRVMHQKPASAGRSMGEHGEAVRTAGRGETPSARTTDTNWGRQSLLEEAFNKENMVRAWKQVKANKGGAGVDGMTIDQAQAHLKDHWPRIREQLLIGTYWPSALRRVTLPKESGGFRDISIPTVVDRLIQQALLQIIQPAIDPTFSPHSYGFRPKRSAHQAVRAAKAYVEAGYKVAIDLDLEKFFDTVNHDILMNRLARHIKDRPALQLIGRFLKVDVEIEGRRVARDKGTPQGGPLSPLLANVMLDEVDKLLESRGHRFVRFADDCNIYVRSFRTGHRVLRWLNKLYGELGLTVNKEKTAVASYRARKFLGYALVNVKGVVRLTVSRQALAKARDRIRSLTSRSGGKSMGRVIGMLGKFIPGWKAYFRLGESPSVFKGLDSWLRHRLRVIQAKHWKRGTTMYRELRKLGASKDRAAIAAGNFNGRWNTGRRLGTILTVEYFDRLGVPKFS